jgi:hypothetical protein
MAQLMLSSKVLGFVKSLYLPGDLSITGSNYGYG